MEAQKLKRAALAIERYARANISERSNAYGQYMYHAELLRRGHVAIHRKDLKDMPQNHQENISKLSKM
jgi:hypothetical protein